MSATAPEPASLRPKTGFGTFKGVFTPSILTILGVVMYLRLGWVLGNTGLIGTLLIVTMSSAVTFLTGLSIAATATNMRVGIGGAYFMISRSLGIEAGAAIGVPLYFAQSLSAAFYVVGFAESVHQAVPQISITAIGVTTLIALTALAYRSADLALRAQYVILATIVVSMISFFIGGPSPPVADAVTVPETESFWIVFAVFFPAVTGIEAGIALSGDLENPGKSLPRGTLAAVGVGWAMYVLIPLVLAARASQAELLVDPMVMARVAWVGELIYLGIWAAALSSALGAILGAPRTLQALARDDIAPGFLAQGSGPANEPRVATALTFGVALIGVVLGSLNAIAPVLSMFFLTSYGFLNLSAGLESLIDSPSWRPRFRTPWYVSLAGAVLCLFVMLMISPGATFIAAAVTGALFYWTARRRLTSNWGSLRHGLFALAARLAIYGLDRSTPVARTWRPNLLVLSGTPELRWHLIELADLLGRRTGFLTVGKVLEEGPEAIDQIRETERTTAAYLDERDVPALVRVTVAEDVMAGAAQLLQATGMGPLRPNTLLVGVSTSNAHREGYLHLLRLAARLECNVIIQRDAGVTRESEGPQRLLVWTGGERQNVGLMLALGELARRSLGPRDAVLEIKSVVDSEDEAVAMRRQLTGLVTEERVDAEVGVIHRDPDQQVFDVIREASREASQVFLGMRAPGVDESLDDYGAYYLDLLDRTAGLPRLAYVMATEDIDFTRIFQ